MSEEEFEKLKDSYEQARDTERIHLAVALAKSLMDNTELKDKLRVVYGGRAGKGRVNYSSGKRIKEYDLSNWKWVEVTDDDDFECIVSLNMPDTDPRSGNSHVLFDRVGLLVSYRINDSYYYETAIHTNIDLPLDEADKEQIAQLVLEQYKIFCEKKEDK